MKDVDVGSLEPIISFGIVLRGKVDDISKFMESIKAADVAHIKVVYVKTSGSPLYITSQKPVEVQ